MSRYYVSDMVTVYHQNMDIIISMLEMSGELLANIPNSTSILLTSRRGGTFAAGQLEI
jgi:hypothetical protein